MPVDPGALRAQRDAAGATCCACGVLLHQLLCGAPVLDEPDTAPRHRAHAAARAASWCACPGPRRSPMPEALRAIANRATAAQERQRYRSARTLLRALEGWREVEAADSGGPLALLLDRLRTVGHLPALPGIGAPRGAAGGHRRASAPTRSPSRSCRTWR